METVGSSYGLVGRLMRRSIPTQLSPRILSGAKGNTGGPRGQADGRRGAHSGAIAARGIAVDRFRYRCGRHMHRLHVSADARPVVREAG